MDTTQYDFDLFFQKGIFKIHAATAGGILRKELIDIEKQDIIRHRALSSEISLELVLNPFLKDILEYKQSLLNQEKIEYQFKTEIYSRSFKGFAEKGFFSFDRTVIGDSNNSEYHLVAYPKKYNFFISMPPNELLCLIFIKNHLNFILDNRKYFKFIKDVFEHNRFCDNNFYFFKYIKNDMLDTLVKDCLCFYRNIKTEDDINLFMDKLKLLYDSLEFIIQLNEKQNEGKGRLSDWLYREIMLVNNLFNIDRLKEF